MAIGTYQLQYFYTFYGLNKDLNRVELLNNTISETITAEEVKATSFPFAVEMPAITNKFDPVRGSGCEINLLSPTNMKYFNSLYHVGYKDILIKHYIDDSINWIGYMNSEMFREPYYEMFNYPVQLTGNDGFSLMDRFHFNQSNAESFIGIKSQFDIIRLIFDKIGLPFNAINIVLSTTIYAIDITETILHSSCIDCANFYKEDGSPETLRSTLEAILATYGAFIVQYKGDIYITDIHNIALNESFTFRSYLLSDGSYIGEMAATNNTVDLSLIGYAGTGQEIEMSGGRNKQTKNYSPYPTANLIPLCLDTTDEFSGTIPSSYTAMSSTHMGKILTGHKYFTPENSAWFEQGYDTTEATGSGDGISVCARWNPQVSSGRVLTLTVPPSFMLSRGVYPSLDPKIGMKISGEMYIGTTHTGIRRAGILFDIKLGSKMARSPGSVTPGSYYWVTPTIYSHYIETDEWASNDINNSFQKFEELIQIDQDLQGDLRMDITANIYVRNSALTLTYNPSYVTDVRIRKLSVTLYDIASGKEITTNDFEFWGYLNPSYKDEGTPVKLLCGSNATCADRGKILYYNSFWSEYYPINGWYRNGNIYPLPIEKLLLNSLSSNYRAGFRILTNMTLNYSSLLKPFGILSDTFYLSGHKFMMTRYKIDYMDSIINADFIEVSPDELTIV